MLERLENAMEKKEMLTQWEWGFVESLLEQYNKRGELSPKQVKVFDRIETQKLSAVAMDSRAKWKETYDEKKREIATVCARYYSKAGYFTDLVHAVLEKEDFVPTEHQWKKMCENKYAKKVLTEYYSESKYPVGSVVEFRSTSDWNMKRKSQGMPCIVISSGGFITSAAKGSKPYKVLPYGATEMIDCEERHLKKCKKPKKKHKMG